MSKAPKSLRRRRDFQRRTAPGAEPGIVQPDPRAKKPSLRVMAYGPDECCEREISSVSELPPFLERYAITWLNVEGLGDADVLKAIGELFGLHKLSLEDVVNTHQRAKVEEYGDRLFIVARMVSLNERVETEQIALFVGQKFVVTFQEGQPGDTLEPVRQRLRTAHGRIRGLNSGHLAYALLDAVIDGYFPVIEQLGDRLEDLEDRVLARPDYHVITQVHELRRELLLLRRAIWPHREALNQLVREEHQLITDEVRIYLRDVYDHTVQLVDLVEVYRETCTSVRDVYLSSVSNRMNEIMKALTVISTIFLPLSFIAGVYGMNFDYLPEIHWRFGYAFAWGLMVAVSGVMLYWFWRRGWLRRGS
jgi:magnesium transporter